MEMRCGDKIGWFRTNWALPEDEGCFMKLCATICRKREGREREKRRKKTGMKKEKKGMDKNSVAMRRRFA